MKTMKTNLHLNLNLSRKDSVPGSGGITPGGPNSANGPGGYMTPVDQNMQFQFQTPAVLSRRSDSVSSAYSDYYGHQPSANDLTALSKCNSISSISSSMYNQSAEGSPINIHNYDFSPLFDEMLVNLYHAYASKPNITPFNINFPPSGIVSKISKQMYHKLANDRSILVDKNQRTSDELMTETNQAVCLSVIRKRLLELCNSGATDSYANGCSISRTNSNASSISFSNPIAANNQPIPLQHRPSWLHQNPMFSATRLSSTDSLVDSVQFAPSQTSQSSSAAAAAAAASFQNTQNDLMMMTPPQSAAGGYSPQVSKPKLNMSQLDHFSFENSTKPLQSPFETHFQVNTPSSTSSGSPPALASKRQINSSISNQPQFFFGAGQSGSNGSLSGNGSNTPNLMDLEVDPFYNVTAQRKRDSLKLKRNMK